MTFHLIMLFLQSSYANCAKFTPPPSPYPTAPPSLEPPECLGTLTATAASAGPADGNVASISLSYSSGDGDDDDIDIAGYDGSSLNWFERGINAVVVSKRTHRVINESSFDLYTSIAASVSKRKLYAIFAFRSTVIASLTFLQHTSNEMHVCHSFQ